MLHTEKLEIIKQTVLKKQKITDEDKNFVNSCLLSDDYEILHPACLISIRQSKDEIDRLIDTFDTFPLKTKQLLISYLATLKYYKVFKFFFQLLQRTNIPNLVNLLTAYIAKSDYPTVPYLLDFLAKSDSTYRKKLENVIKIMDLEILEPSLALLPEIPCEEAFRNALGDKKVDEIKAKRKK